jgi:hypothetical protein
MTNPQPNQKPVRVVGGAATEIYANKVVTTAFDGGALVVTLGVHRITPERIENVSNPANLPSPSVHISARIALSPGAAIELINALNGTLKAAQAQAAQVQAQIAQAQALASAVTANKVKIRGHRVLPRRARSYAAGPFF